MAKSEKPKKAPVKKTEDPEESSKKTSSRAKKQEEDEDDDDLDETEEVAPKKGRKAGASSKAGKNGEDEDDDDAAEDEPDEWEKPEVEEEWDPDFDEFDIPKSTGKKSTGTKKAAGEEEDFAIDDEFKDLGFFDDASGGFDDDEDDF